MRNLSECQAEVFRRSEKRIKERKNRRIHMLMACVPVVLCIALLLPAFLPDYKAESPNAMGTPDSVMDGMSEIVYEGHSKSNVSVTVSGVGLSNVFEYDSAKRILEYLYSFGTRGSETNGMSDDKVIEENGESAYDGLRDDVGSLNGGYTITLVMGENKTVYCLDANMLENLTTKQTYPLSEKQAKELKELLGIPHP